MEDAYMVICRLREEGVTKPSTFLQVLNKQFPGMPEGHFANYLRREGILDATTLPEQLMAAAGPCGRMASS